MPPRPGYDTTALPGDTPAAVLHPPKQEDQTTPRAHDSPQGPSQEHASQQTPWHGLSGTSRQDPREDAVPVEAGSCGNGLVRAFNFNTPPQLPSEPQGVDDDNDTFEPTATPTSSPVKPLNANAGGIYARRLRRQLESMRRRH